MAVEPNLAGPIVAVDFDGTVVQHRYPELGDDIAYAVDGLNMLHECGCRIVLWTMRDKQELQDAIDWYAHHGVPLWGHNTNPEQQHWTSSPKAYAQLYIDDAALGCPLIRPPDGSRPYVDWRSVMQQTHIWLSACTDANAVAVRQYRERLLAISRGRAPRPLSKRAVQPVVPPATKKPRNKRRDP